VVSDICEQTDNETNGQTDRQTYVHTDTVIAILRTPTGGDKK